MHRKIRLQYHDTSDVKKEFSLVSTLNTEILNVNPMSKKFQGRTCSPFFTVFSVPKYYYIIISLKKGFARGNFSVFKVRTWNFILFFLKWLNHWQILFMLTIF